MSNNVLLHSFQFSALVLVQVLILNHINFLGYINPYAYVLFILLFPTTSNRLIFLLLSFAIGLSIDVFSDSGGVHAAASVTIAFIRPALLKFCFGSVNDHHTIKFNNTDFGARLSYFTMLILLHHILLFALEIFNLNNIILILQKALFSGIFTIILCLIIHILFSRKS
ncbi:rod shape-determining protein MreD [Bizionia sediminis]|uniref:Rod shape-determining protein MreD n=1 Tax=Bizionia sediminis TaxID=1737064 RepID=A0ABW5KSR1_9FLAO